MKESLKGRNFRILQQIFFSNLDESLVALVALRSTFLEDGIFVLDARNILGFCG